MGRPRLEQTNVDRILEALSKKEQSTQEVAENLKIPLSTVRSTLSFLTRTELTEFVPIVKRGKNFTPETTPGKRRAKKFKLTSYGIAYLEEHRQEAPQQ